MSVDTAKSKPRERRKPQRVPVSGRNDPLAVEGKDPKFFYYWVHDESENGTEILKYKQAGYVFAQKSEGLKVGSASVRIHEDVGSHIRVSAGSSTGGYLFLMRQPMEYREEDLAEKAAIINETEQSFATASPDGQYGEVKISRN